MTVWYREEEKGERTREAREESCRENKTAAGAIWLFEAARYVLCCEAQ